MIIVSWSVLYCSDVFELCFPIQVCVMFAFLILIYREVHNSFGHICFTQIKQII